MRRTGWRTRTRVATTLAVALTVVMTACGGGGGKSNTSGGQTGGKKNPVTIEVWDYYGDATPIKPAIAGFQKAYPWITVKYQALDWDTAHEKFTVVVSSGTPPDAATLDMTWIPTFASNGLLANLSDVSGGRLNGKPINQQYTKGALQAMTFQGHHVTMLFDFDVYAMYYRKDLFEKKGIKVPTTWDELRTAAKQLAEDTNGDGKPDKYRFEIGPDTFHWSQFLFQNGGSILTPDNTQAALNSPDGVAALQAYKSLVDDGTGIYWGEDQGDAMLGVKDGRIAMFNDGPYWMGLLKDGAPELAGKWGVTLAPYSKQPGSYLGGTGLSIPANAKHPQEAWLFIQYMLKLENQLGVAKYAGAAPATTAALQSSDLTQPDPYFDNQVPFKVFLQAMSTATHFPYVKSWDDVDVAITDAVAAALLGKKSPQQALNEAAQQVNDLIAGG